MEELTFSKTYDTKKLKIKKESLSKTFSSGENTIVNNDENRIKFKINAKKNLRLHRT